jgi:hypothetical protein
MDIMKNRWINVIILLLWVSMLIYFFNMNTEAFILFLLIPPLIGILLYFAIKTKYIILTLFFGLAFLGTSITPAFFFLNKSDYSYSGFSAIKDFNFDIYEFLQIYGHLYLMLCLILFFTIILNKKLIKDINKKKSQTSNPRQIIFANTMAKRPAIEKKINSNKRIYSIYIFLFIICIMMPLNIVMYLNGIGIATVEPVAKIFKIVGITFYFRNYIAPLIIAYLYFKSNRNNSVTFFILFYAAFIGVLSLGKGNVALTCLPVLLFALLDSKKARLVLSVLYFIILYGTVSWARQFVLLADVGSFEMIKLIFDNFLILPLSESLNIISTLGEFAGRLYGANVIVLAYRYNLENNIIEAVNFYLGKSENLSSIIFNEVFGMVGADGVVIGVGMGYLGTMILLANKNLLLLALLSFITAFYLSISEVIVRKYTINTNIFASIGYGLGFFMVFFLYDGFLKFYYIILSISIFGMFFYTIKNKFIIY